MDNNFIFIQYLILMKGIRNIYSHGQKFSKVSKKYICILAIIHYLSILLMLSLCRCYNFFHSHTSIYIID